MRLSPLALVLLLAQLAPNAAAQDPAGCEEPREPRSEFERKADFRGDPIPQIQAHLAGVIARLEARDVAHLPEATRERRDEQIAELARYSAAASFPVNTVRPYPTPIFIDDAGRACAVGHLMIASNRPDLAQEIRTLANLAYVPDIRVPGVHDWMESVGLSAEECALIQPAYGPCGAGSGIHAGSTCTPTTLNSSGYQATLVGCGSNMVAANSCLLLVGGLPENCVGYFLNARGANALDTPGASQGTLCLSGAVGRHDRDIFMAQPPTIVGPNPGPGWWAGIVLDLTQMPTPTGLTAVLPGDTWYFQAWYRDVNPKLTSNLSDVIWITFS